jgi:hypothetical protein
MLGRKNYTQQEVDRARSTIDRQVSAFRALVAADGAAGGEVPSAVEVLEPLLANTLVLVLDRFFVHRVRTVTGKNTNPLSEVELLTDSLLSNDGVFEAGSVVKYKPEQSVLGLKVGDPIRLTVDQVERLAGAFLAEIESKFLEG